jgi:O-antigen ligase
MVALPVIPINADAGFDNQLGKAHRYTPTVVAACLLLLLAFSTATAFVQDAWAPQSFEIGIFVLLAGYMLAGIARGWEHLAGGLAPWLVYLIPFWGVVQLVAHTTASSVETRKAVLSWGALAGVFFLTQTAARTRAARRNILSAFLIFATAIAVLCLTELFTSGGQVLWVFPSGYPNVYATFVSRNGYSQFVELALPIALWRALREGWRSWWYVISGGILFGSVIGSASRAGAVLCTAELLAMLAIGLVKLRDPETGLPSRPTTAMLLIVPVLAATFTIAVGWERVWLRLQEKAPYVTRQEFLQAAADMAKNRPLTGYGLGTFPLVYPRYAIIDPSLYLYVNHAHNDWAEFAADGGIPFLLLVLIPFAAVLPAVIRNPWGLGLMAAMLHACVDFPFFHPGVPGWMFVLLALLYMSRMPDESRQQRARPVISARIPVQKHI